MQQPQTPPVKPFATQALTEWPALLLPVRLEVRRVINATVNDVWIRVFPDQPFVDSHQPQLTAKEREDGTLLVHLLEGWGTSVTLDEMQSAWKELARRYGPPRAAWIVEKIRFHTFDGDAQTSSDKIPELFLLPTHFHFLLYKGDTLAYHDVSKPVLPSRTILPAPTAANDSSPPADGLFDANSRWITDFDAAVEAGLGIKIPLVDNDRTATELTFSSIVAVGLREGGPGAGIQALQELMSSHRFTNGFEFLPYGSPTNNTAQAPSAHSQSDEQLLASFDLEIRSPLEGLSAERRTQTVAATFARLMGLPAELQGMLAHVKGCDNVDDAVFPLVFDTVWPSTGDYFFSRMLGLSGEITARTLMHDHARRYLRPRGHLPAVRIGNQPYGILPVTRTRRFDHGVPTGWAPSDEDYRLNNTALKVTDFRTFDDALFRVLDALYEHWLGKASETSAVPKAGDGPDPDAELLTILGMGPHSLDYRERAIVDSPFVIMTINLLADSLMGSSSSFSGLGTVPEVLPTWVGQRQEMVDFTQGLLEEMGADPSIANSNLMGAFSWGQSKELLMSLVRHPPVAPALSDGPEDYLPLLQADGGRAAPTASNTVLYDLVRRSLQLASDQPALVPQIAPAVAALSDLPILEYFNESVDPEDLVTLLPNDVAQSAGNLARELTERRVRVHGGRFTTVRQITDVFDDFVQSGGGAIFPEVYRRVRATFDKRLEWALRSILDALTYRLDAWYSTLPIRRIDLMRDRRPEGIHWGAFGYVEDVEVPPATVTRGQPADGGGYIHAPSVSQATAAGMLRSAFDSHRADGDNAYALNLSSTRVRQALALIDGVQQGQELAVLLGYQFERRLHDEALDRIIDDFRAKFPYAEPEDEDVAEPTEIVPPRNVVDGRQLIDAYNETQGLDQFEIDSIKPPGFNTADTSKLVAILKELKSAADAISDLLLYEGIYQGAQGNYDRSGAAMDASAGLGRPPDIDSVATHSRGNTLRHRVGIFLPYNIGITGTAPTARSRAEPRLDAWFASSMGELIDVGCTAYSPPDSATPIRLTLDELGIATIDFLEMCASLPDGTGDTEIEIRIRKLLRMRDGLPATQAIRIAFAEIGSDKHRSVADALELGKALLDMLGDATLMTPASMFHPDEIPPAPAADEPASTLYTEVAAFRQRAQEALDVLSDQKVPLASSTASDVEAALDMCVQYGIKEALLELDEGDAIFTRGLAVLEVIGTRVERATQLIAEGTSDDDRSVASLSAAFKALFGEGFIAITPFDVAPFGNSAAYAATSIRTTPSDARIWLWFQQVAETHPRVRKLETLLMMAEAWGATRSNSDFAGLRIAQVPFRPEFGWQALSDTEPGATPLRPDGTAVRAKGCLSMVAMVPQPFSMNSVAGFVFDEWTETMPAPHVITGISFEYNQPASHAPQCFLLAAPGNFRDSLWRPDHVADIVRDTMALAKTRLVDLDAYPPVAGILPALMFPGSYMGPTVRWQVPPGSITFPPDDDAGLQERTVDSLAEFADALSEAR